MPTTISGSLRDLSTAAKANGVYVRFRLQGCAGNQPRIAGTGVIAPQDISFTPNASGVISGTLYSTRDNAGTGNGEIEVGGSLTAVWYKMEVYVGGVAQAPINVHAKNGATLDISNVTPITTNPVIVAPTGDTTYARLDGGNQPFTAAISAPNQASGNLGLKPASTAAVIYLTAAGSDSNDGLSWGSAKATLSAAISAIPSTGGTIYFSGTIAQNSVLTLKSNLNVIGLGSAQIDGVTGPATITTTITSGDLFYLNGFNDCYFANFSIKNLAAAGANAAIRLTAAQRNTFERIYVAGPWARYYQLDSSSSAAASCIWNMFRSCHGTGGAASSTGLLLDSTDATNKVINSNTFWDMRLTAGAGGVACKLTNSGVHNQIINENVFNLTEASASGGTALLVDNGSTRGCVFIDCNLEGSTTGLNKATSNTLTFIGGNLSSNGTNVTDAQPAFTHFIGTNVGGTVQSFAITPAGGVYVDGLGLNGATPANNTISGTNGWGLGVSGSTQATVNNTTPVIKSQGSAGITLLNEQPAAAEINGTGAAVTVYTYTLPANTMAAGKGIRIKYWANHSTGAGAMVHQITFGGTLYFNVTDSGATGQVYVEVNIYNNAGVTNAQHGSTCSACYPGVIVNATSFTGLTSAIATTSNVTIAATFNSAAGTKLTPGEFIVELIQ